MSSTDGIVLLTKCYAGDFERCRALCASIDMLMPDRPHYLVVERCDRALFAPLVKGQRKLVTTESLLPEFIRIRRPNGQNIWLSPYRLKPLDGWHVQQFAKLACAARLEGEAVVMVDSDVEFLRPIDPAQIVRDGRTRMLRYTLVRTKSFLGNWARSGAKVLGLREPEAPPTVNYVQNLVSWRPHVVRALLAHVERTTGMSWKKALCHQRTFSEYYLYGLFVDHVDGTHQDLVFLDDKLLCHTLLYGFDHPDSPSEEAFVAALEEWHVAFGLQSNIKMPEARRHDLAARLRIAGGHR